MKALNLLLQSRRRARRRDCSRGGGAFEIFLIFGGDDVKHKESDNADSDGDHTTIMPLTDQLQLSRCLPPTMGPTGPPRWSRRGNWEFVRRWDQCLFSIVVIRSYNEIKAMFNIDHVDFQNHIYSRFLTTGATSSSSLTCWLAERSLIFNIII